MIANHFQTFSRFGHVRFMIFNYFHNFSYLFVVSAEDMCDYRIPASRFSEGAHQGH